MNRLAFAAVLMLVLTAACSSDSEPQGFSGDEGPRATNTPAGPTNTPSPPLTVTVSSPVQHGGDATAAVSGAEAGADCSITYRTPIGSESSAAGLTKKSASAAGTADWKWNIGAATEPGEGRVVVRCGTRTGTATITIQ